MIESLASAYINAKISVINSGYANEVDWQDNIRIDNITETIFLNEMAWVILSSGLSELVVKKVFPKVSKSFYNWDSAQKIVNNKCYVKKSALQQFAHVKKIDSIIKISHTVSSLGFNNFLYKIKLDKIDYIQTLPFMGPATSYHLAKNIGLEVVKPDRHLVRIAKKFGYSFPLDMCKDISKHLEEKISVIDIVLWRYATLNKNYLFDFK